MAVAAVLHQGGKLVQLDGSFSLVLVSHQVRHPRHVVPYILAHGDFYGLAPPVAGPVDVDGAYPSAGAAQAAQHQHGPHQAPGPRPHAAAGAAGARLPPGGAWRWGGRARGQRGRQPLQRPLGCCPARDDPRPSRGSRAAGQGGAELSIARAGGSEHRPAPTPTPAPAAVQGGGRGTPRAGGTGSSAPSPQLRQTYCGEPGNFLVSGLPLLRSVLPPPFLLLLVLVRALSAAQRPCPGRVPRGFASPSSALSRREVGMGLSERGVKEEEISKPSKRGGSKRCPAPPRRPRGWLCEGPAPRLPGGAPLRSAPPASAATARLEQPGCSGGG